mgnify:CR=1 FL=1
MRLPIAIAATAFLVSAPVLACEDYQSQAAAKVPASMALSAPAASKVPDATAKKVAAQKGNKQATAEPNAADRQEVIAGLRKE